MSLRTYNYRGTGRFRAVASSRTPEKSPQRFHRATRNGFLLQRLDDPNQTKSSGLTMETALISCTNAVLVCPEIRRLAHGVFAQDGTR